ncbi:MAG: Flp family type IVb pilin [Sphingosinicella sp.]
MKKLRALFSDNQGVTAVEYGLILAMIFLAMILGVSAFGQQTTSMWNYVATKVVST